MGQLSLDFGFAPRLGAEDYLVADSNVEAHDALLRWPDWPDRVMVLAGAEGSGKTHVAAIWAEQAGARMIAGPALAHLDPRAIADGPAVIDDADAIGPAENVLFHALNLVRETGSALLLTARGQPDAWGLRTADLLSRLRLAPLLRLHAPDEQLLRAVLVKLFLDRQLSVDQGLVDYAALRLDRSLAMARRFVDAVDRASLATGRRITRGVAAGALDDLLGLA